MQVLIKYISRQPEKPIFHCHAHLPLRHLMGKNIWLHLERDKTRATKNLHKLRHFSDLLYENSIQRDQLYVVMIWT